MHISTLLLVTPLALTLAHPSTPDPLSIRMAHSITTRNDGIYTPTLGTSGPLQAGIVQKTLYELTKQYPSHTLTPSLKNYTTASARSLLPILANATSVLHFSLDRLSGGNALLALSSQTGEAEYARAVSVLKTSVDQNQRNAESGLWYFVYPNWSYLDGMFSFGPFAALYTLTHAPGNETAWADLQRQFDLLGEHCEMGDSGLLVHGYDDTRTAVWANNTLGQSPHVWGRSLGWYVLGLLETISIIDSHGGNQTGAKRVRDTLEVDFRHRMDAVVKAVDPMTGAWWQVIDQPGRVGNYIESSASSMFVWALLGGVRRGYLPASTTTTGEGYVDVGLRAYGYVRDTFVVDNGNGTLGWNGTVSVCSLNSTASYEYYTSRPILYNSVLGSAAFVGASLEVERWGKHEL